MSQLGLDVGGSSCILRRLVDISIVTSRSVSQPSLGLAHSQPLIPLADVDLTLIT